MSDRWPMLERLAVSALNAELGQGRAGTELPAGDRITFHGGFVRVSRGPGGDDGITDRPLLDLEAFHSDQVEAWNIAEDARQIVLALPGSSAGGHLIDTLDTATGPNRVEYSSELERYVASYRVSYRR